MKRVESIEIRSELRLWRWCKRLAMWFFINSFVRFFNRAHSPYVAVNVRHTHTHTLEEIWSISLEINVFHDEKVRRKAEVILSSKESLHFFHFRFFFFLSRSFSLEYDECSKWVVLNSKRTRRKPSCNYAVRYDLLAFIEHTQCNKRNHSRPSFVL